MISSSKGDIPQDIPDATPIAALPEISDVVIQPTDTDIIKAEISNTEPSLAPAVILSSDNQGEDVKMEVVASDVDKQTQVVINAADEVIPPQTEIASTKEVVIEESQEATMGQDVIEQPSNEADSPINKSYHVRIDNFQRPLTDRLLFEWLAKILGHDVRKEQLWMNKIKTHCYIDFDSVELAKACIAAVTGEKVDSKHTLKLVADFTDVSAAAAENSIEAKMKPNEWKNMKNVPSDTPNRFLKARSGPVVQATVATATAPHTTEILKKANLIASNNVVKPNFTSGTPVGESIRGNEQVGFSTRRNSGAAASITTVPPTHQTSNSDSSSSQNQNKSSQETFKVENKGAVKDQNCGDILELDSLFRKTKALPPLYWLPVSDEVVRKRKLLSAK